MRIRCIINKVASYVFRPPIVAIFREMVCEGYITKNVKTIYTFEMLSCILLTECRFLPSAQKNVTEMRSDLCYCINKLYFTYNYFSL
jgi:hypothetical protein